MVVRGVGKGDVVEGAACGEDAGTVRAGAGAAWAGTDPGAFWIAEEPTDGEGTAEAEGRDAAEAGAALVDTTRGAAAAPWPLPNAIARAMPAPVKASTAVRAATPDRKLISSKRAFIARLSLAAQPIPSLTTKHDTSVLAVLVGRCWPKPAFRNDIGFRRPAKGVIYPRLAFLSIWTDGSSIRAKSRHSPVYLATLRKRR